VDDIFAIQMLKAAYFRAIDTKDWDLLRSVMLEDVEIDVTDDTATGIWAMEDYVDWGPAEDGTPRAFRGYGHYRERYVKGSDGPWRIAALQLTRLRRDWL